MHMVLPGVEEVSASFFLLVSALMRDDLPTLLRPMKAYSTSPLVGHFSRLGLEPMYLADVIFMLILFVYANSESSNHLISFSESSSVRKGRRLESWVISSTEVVPPQSAVSILFFSSSSAVMSFSNWMDSCSSLKVSLRVRF